MSTGAKIPPGPKPKAITGHLLYFREDMLGFLSNAASTYGDIFSLRLAHKPAIFVKSS